MVIIFLDHIGERKSSLGEVSSLQGLSVHATGKKKLHFLRIIRHIFTSYNQTNKQGLPSILHFTVSFDRGKL